MELKVTFSWLIAVTLINAIQTQRSPTNETQNYSRSQHLPDCPGKALTVVVMETPPYVIYNTSQKSRKLRGVMVDLFKSTIRMCYKDCNITWKVVNNTRTFIDDITSNQGNIAFPVTSSLAINLTWPWYQGHPITLRHTIMSRSRAVIVNKHHFNKRLKTIMLQDLLDTWPIFAYTIALAGLSGVCIWILESRANSDDFQKSFTRGWFEGFWWAFVSMTTVGYGDKTPKTILGRAFGTLWILIGLVMIAIFTAKATNALTTTHTGIGNFKVAVLSSTDAPLHAASKGARTV
ncbi:hypothetical protein QZH41_010734, partial [Actinostola sp. cb2023]